MSQSRNNLSKPQNPDNVITESGGSKRTYGYEQIQGEEQFCNKSGHMLSHRETVPSSPTTTDKYFYDSGCLSGALTSEQSLSCDLLSANIVSSGSIKDKNYSDSGFVDENSMRLDSSDCGNALSEHFSELDLKKSHLNDLNADCSRTINTESTTNIPIVSLKKPSTTTPAVPQQPQFDSQFDFQFCFVQDDDGDTQLHLAILQGFIEVVYGLIRIAPEPCWLDVPNDNHLTPMHLAVLTGQAPIVRALLVAGASPDALDRHGNNPLHLACASGATDCVHALLHPISVVETMSAGLRYNPATTPTTSAACLIDEPNYDGQLCVHMAAAGGYVEVLRHLLWSGADINGREAKLGRTPLHVAAERGGRRVALFLLTECSAVDVHAITYAGHTAYQMAQFTDAIVARELAKRGSYQVESTSSSEDESDSDEEDGEIIDRLPRGPAEGFFRRAIVA